MGKLPRKISPDKIKGYVLVNDKILKNMIIPKYMTKQEILIMAKKLEMKSI